MELPEGIDRGADGVCRCAWGASHADYFAYHDDEWGVPEGDDNRLYEKVCLEAFQSGLSWLTILRKRENFRRAFLNFDPALVSKMTEDDKARLMDDASIVRNRKKIDATIHNASRALEMQSEFGSLAAYFWQFEPTRREQPIRYGDLLTTANTDASKALAKDLKNRGWRFVGPTTAYAFMQAMGLVNDHAEGCDSYKRVDQMAKEFVRPTPKEPRTQPSNHHRTESSSSW